MTAIDPTARCSPDHRAAAAAIGAYSVVHVDAQLGRGVVLGAHVVVAGGAALAERVRVEDGAVVGAGARVAAGATIGAGAVVATGAEVGPGAHVLDGALVQRGVPRDAVVAGTPSTITGYVGSEALAAGDPTRSAPPREETFAVQGVRLIRLPTARDLRGSLVAGEVAEILPFVPRRYFVVLDVPSEEVRGEHAHRSCHQFLTAIHGRLHVMVDDGRRRQDVVLEDEHVGLYVPPMTWAAQYRYSADCRLLVLASHAYDPGDYIRDYGTFLAEVGGA